MERQRASILFFVFAIMIISGCAGQTLENNENPSSMDTTTNTSKASEEITMAQIVVIETTQGTIEIELNKEKAPTTVTNFLQYVNSGFYDGTVFHRVIGNFMIQGGGFTSNGTQKATRDPIALESKNGLSNMKYTVAMARTSIPDSATSQFFINVQDNTFLDYRPGNDGYAVFGKVVKGMDVVDKIKAVKTSTRGRNADWPIEDVVITRMYVKK